MSQLDGDHQTTFQKAATFITGLGGISLKFADVANFAQEVGMIVGCVLVCGQAYIFFRDIIRKHRNGTKKP